MVEQLLQLLVGVVDAELLKGVELWSRREEDGEKEEERREETERERRSEQVTVIRLTHTHTDRTTL